MDQSYIDFFLNENININLEGFVLNLIVTLLLCFLVRLVYIKFSTTLSNKREFSKNFIILGLTTCIVITIVKSSLALSLGLVGALSIVRFRAAIKEPEELVYLFLVIAIGLGAGAGQILIIIIGSIVSLIVIIIFYNFNVNDKRKIQDNLHLSISINNQISKIQSDGLINIIKQQVSYLEISSLNQSKDNFVINLFFILSDAKTLSTLNEVILKEFPDANIIVSKDHNISL